VSLARQSRGSAPDRTKANPDRPKMPDTFDRSGDVVAEKPQLQIVTSWDRLRQVLLKAIDRQRYHFGHVFERVEQDGDSVHVRFVNGRSVSAPTFLSGAMGFGRVSPPWTQQAWPS